MIFTEQNTNLKFPNISVKTRLRDGKPCAYVAYADDGYVIYDKTAEIFERTSPDSEPKKVNHYYSKIICPLSYNFSDFPWQAVPKSKENEKYTF